MRQAITYARILDARDSNGVGSPIEVRDYKIIVIAVSGANSPDLDLRIKGTIVNQLQDIDFSVAASPTNQHDNVGLYEYRSANFVDGSTGVEFVGTAYTKLYEINVSGLTYICPEVANWAAGDVTVTLAGFSNL
jgi:hypothetical protein